MDLRSEVLLRTVRGALNGERFFIGHALDHLTEGLDDLRKATTVLRQVPEIVDPYVRAWSWYLMGSLLLRKFDLNPRRDDLADTLEALNTARAVRGARPLVRAAILKDLAAARIEEAELAAAISANAEGTGTVPASVDHAIAVFSQLVDDPDLRDVDRVTLLQNLATLYLRRGQRLPGGRTDLRAGLAAVDRALAIVPEDDRQRVFLLLTRSSLTAALGRPSPAADEAAHAQAVAFADPEALGSATDRLMHHAAAGSWNRAVEAGREGLRVLADLLARQPHPEYQRVWLRHADHVSTMTAYAEAMAGRPLEAAAVLEEGKAVVLANRYDRPRAIVTALLAAGRHDLAVQYSEAMRVLWMHGADDRKLRAAADQVNGLMPMLRELPDVARLTQPVTGDTVRTATGGRTVAYVASSLFGGFAIVIGPTGDTDVVMLPTLTTEGLEREAARFVQRTVALTSTPRVRASGIRETCRWLGHAVMAPLADALGDARAAVLVPVGALSGLPLHAAPTTRGAPALADRLYTYAPRATMLRRPSPPIGPDRDIVAVADPARATGGGLPGTRAKVAALARCFPGVHCLAGPDATTRAVLQALPAASLVHMGCHGISDPLSPMRSVLLLAGTDRLRLSDLLVTDVAHVDLVFLSACQSAVSDSDLPGESMNLAAGLAAAGARAVIGSLWPVNDEATADLTEAFYKAVVDGVPSAWALRSAQLRLATGPPPWSDPYFWAGLVYTGG
jgi:hypothetical protein